MNPPSRTELLALIAADEIEAALAGMEQAVEALPADGRADLVEELVLLRSQWQALEKQHQADTDDPDDLRRQRNRLKRALITVAQDLPDETPSTGPKTPPRPRGMDEGRFRWTLFLLMLGVKAWLVYWTSLQGMSGGFSREQTQAVIALLVASFTAYTGPMLAELLRRRSHPATASGPRVAAPLRWFTWIFIAGYGLILHNLIGEGAAGLLADANDANFANMTKWLAIVESGLGVYLGLMISEFFKKGK